MKTLASFAILSLFAACVRADPTDATYDVRVSQLMLSVTAVLPIDGDTLEMSTTRPADIKGVGEHGWPELVRHLRVVDADGRDVETTRTGTRGWRLSRHLAGPVTLTYDVDDSPLSVSGWPAPREAAFADKDHFAFIGRSLFITTPATRRSVVTFRVPRHWQVVAPWQSAANRRFIAPSRESLADNFIVMSRTMPEIIMTPGLRVQVVAIGPWKRVRAEIKVSLAHAIESFGRLLPVEPQENYVVLLLPVPERGGESYRNSFALTFDELPSRPNMPVWANYIAHEIFHYWNGWRLHGADYATSQWFQEGFTEYMANVALVRSGGMTEDEFLAKLTEHLQKYKTLTTSMTGGGTHKGPPLYGAGALVAFSWDVLIRSSSNSQRSLAGFWRALWSATRSGERPYEWNDLRSALDATAPDDWDAFYRRFIEGREPLPIEDVLGRVGLRLTTQPGGSSRIERDSSAPDQTHALWRRLIAP